MVKYKKNDKKNKKKKSEENPFKNWSVVLRFL